jgi:hypothetical protein
MADGIFFKKQNAAFDKLFKDLDKYAKEVIIELDAEMGAGLENMATQAKTFAPVDTGRLRGAISVHKHEPLVYDLRAETDYAAYVEFGTGPYAESYVPSLDTEWQEYAKTFQKSKPGHTPQKPFFYRAVRDVFPIMIERMKKVLEP